MDKTPFSIYDFFGYLADGFFLLLAIDLAFNKNWLLTEEIGLISSIFLAITSYIAGHIIANIAGYLLEEKFVKSVLGEPATILLGSKVRSKWRKIFPGFFRPLPSITRERVLTKAKEAGIAEPGLALFYHCYGIVKNNPITLGRLHTFLNLYGFCRNISMSLLLAAVLLLTGLILDRYMNLSFDASKLWWCLAAIFAAIGMLYRYLKFFRHFSVEVFITYAESD